ncbi:hypothetical protein PG984_015499 [Apiospora sp. TS-2023a]
MDNHIEREDLPGPTTALSQAVGERVYAKPFHFDAYRDTITYLYARDGLALTLKETMQVMEKRYNFYATPRKYKAHLASWGLQKNRTREGAYSTTSQQVQVGTRAPPLHRAADRRVGKDAVGEDWVRELMRHISLERAARGRRAPPMVPLQLPDILRVPERYMHYIREMVQLCWEIKVNPHGSPGSNQPMNEWFGLVTLACRLLEYGRVRQGFRVINQCFDGFADVVLRDLHPAAWVYGYVAGFLLGFQSPDLGRSYARFAQKLLTVSGYPRPKVFEFCPVTPTFESKGGAGGAAGGLSEVSLLCGRQLCEFHMAEMGRRRTGAPGECEFVLTDGIQHYGDIRDIHLGIGMLQKNIMWTSRKGQVVPEESTFSRELRDRDGRAWLCVRSGRYDEAWSLLDDGVTATDLALARAENPDDVISYYHTRALLAQSDERQPPAQVVAAGTALIELLKAEYGLVDYRTIDAQADLEVCLRKRGLNDLADEVRRDINRALDAVERMDATHSSSLLRAA